MSNAQMNDTQKKDLLAAKELASRERIPLPLAAMRMHGNNITNELYWNEPLDLSDDHAGYASVDLISHGGWLADFAVSVAQSIQFPPNTAFLHLLGVLSCGTAKSFRYEYYGDSSAVNLYAVTAQPPSSGKSGVHKRYAVPLQMALNDFNRDNAIEQQKIISQIEDIEAQIKSAKKDGELDINKVRELEELREQRDALNRIEFAFDDITPEAAESKAMFQGGLINIASAEADALNIILGDVYKGQSGKANYGMFLKTWDMEWHSPSRITRDTKAGFVYGSVAVIAQLEAIHSILEVGMSGRGISERMLLLSEKPVLGNRNHKAYEPVDKTLAEQYRHLAHNVIFERDEVTLKIPHDAMNLITDYRQAIEPKLADDGEYSNSMIRGAMGKADKQIIKIACLLHISEEWGGQYATRNPNVRKDKVESAISIFDQLSQTYIQAASSLGYAGDDTEMKCLIESLERLVAKHKMRLRISQFRDIVKNLKAMKNVPSLTDKIRDQHLPRLQRLGYIAVDGEMIYINPRMR